MILGLARRLHKTIEAVCPITRVSIQDAESHAATIDYAVTATDPQKAAALAVLASFGWTQADQDAWNDAQRPERKSIRDAAAQAITDNNTYVALAAPTNAQVAAQVKRLTQECTAIIKRLVQID